MILTKKALFFFPIITFLFVACGGGNEEAIDLTTTSQNANNEENLSQTPFLNPQLSLDFNTTQDKNITINGATIFFKAHSFSEDIIHIDASYYDDNVSTQATFPGNFTGIENNQTFPINSYGYFRVQLKDSNGDKVALLQNAQLTFPLTQTSTTPQTLSLWNFNETIQAWEEAGSATLNQAQDAYNTDVSHFSYWNIAEKKEPARLKGCIEDENGTLRDDATLSLRTQQWFNLTSTNDKGLFDFSNIPAEENLTLSIFIDDSEMHQAITPLIANEIRDISECILFQINEIQSSLTIVSGHVVDENNQTIQNATITLRASGLRVSSVSDSNGDFSFSLNTSLLQELESFNLSVIKPEAQLSGSLDVEVDSDTDFSNLTIVMRELILS